MKIEVKNIRRSLIFALLFSAGSYFAQTMEQSRYFVNRGHVAVAKVEKEMFYAGKNEHDAEIKSAIKFQMAAVKLFKEEKYTQATAYSWKSRVICMEICTKMGIKEGSSYALNNDEKNFFDPERYTDFKYKQDLIGDESSKIVDELDVLNIGKFQELELGIIK